MKLLYFAFAFLLLNSGSVEAGRVRRIRVDSSKMSVINLAMGSSTVLHFFEKPIKVIGGNNNYFNIEFTGNDVTIQPLGDVDTNLFIYGEYHRYGFLLKVCNCRSYDDLVKVRWKTSISRSAGELRKSEFLKRKLKGRVFKIGESIASSITKIQHDQRRDLLIVDFELRSLQDKKIETNDLLVWCTRRGKSLGVQGVVFDKESLDNKGSLAVGRLFLRIEKKRSFTFRMKLGEIEAHTIVSVSDIP